MSKLIIITFAMILLTGCTYQSAYEAKLACDAAKGGPLQWNKAKEIYEHYREQCIHEPESKLYLLESIKVEVQECDENWHKNSNLSGWCTGDEKKHGYTEIKQDPTFKRFRY